MQIKLSGMEKAFNKLCYATDRRKAWDLFLDYFLHSLSLFDPEKDKKMADVLNHFPENNRSEAKQIMLDLMHQTAFASDPDGNGLVDALGVFYMMHVGTGQMGQFFTPTEVCNVMADVVINEKDKTKLKGKTVCDPSVGSGGTLMAAARHSKEMKFYGADLDRTCCKMCVINMVMNDMQGEIAHMDSLSLQYYESWIVTRAYIPPMPSFIHTTDKEKCIFFRVPECGEQLQAAAKARTAYVPGLF